MRHCKTCYYHKDGGCPIFLEYGLFGIREACPLHSFKSNAIMGGPFGILIPHQRREMENMFQKWCDERQIKWEPAWKKFDYKI